LLVNVAMTCVVSTLTSRSPDSPTSAVAVGAGVDAAGVPSLFAAAGAVVAAGCADVAGAGCGAGFEKNVWYA